MPFLIDAGGVLKGGLGAPDQRINRMGSRFGVAVTMPPMRSAKQGRQWVAALVRAQADGARMRFPQPGFDPGAPGTPQVNGSGQAGSTLSIKAAATDYIFRVGQFFSVLTGGAHYVYMVATETITGISGVAAVPIVPMIRAQHLDSDPIHIGPPMIEGFVSGDERQWVLSVGGITSLEFEIRERA